MKWMKQKCSDLKCVRKPSRSRLSLTRHANKSSRWAENDRDAKSRQILTELRACFILNMSEKKKQKIHFEILFASKVINLQISTTKYNGYFQLQPLVVALTQETYIVYMGGGLLFSRTQCTMAILRDKANRLYLHIICLPQHNFVIFRYFQQNLVIKCIFSCLTVVVKFHAKNLQGERYFLRSPSS